MAKRRKDRVKEETRKQTAFKRRDAERNRRVVITLAAVGALLVILIGAGVGQELLVKPRQPVAVVNDARITTRDYGKRVRFSWFQDNTSLDDPQGTSIRVLDQMIDEQLLREQAELRGITVSEDEITETIEKSFGYLRTPPTPTPTPALETLPGDEPTATPMPTATPVTLEAYQDAFKDYVKRLEENAGMKETDFRKLIEVDLLRQKLYDDVIKDVPSTEEQVKARHILVSVREPQPTPTPVAEGEPTPTPNPNAVPTPAPRNEAEALARVNEVKGKLDAGEDFAALALEYSDDTGSAANGGDLGWFGRGRMVPEFEDVAFSLEPGQIGDPVLTQFGYHVIQVEEKDPAHEVDAFTLPQKQYEAYSAWLQEIRDQAQIERTWSLEKVPPTPSLAQRF